MGHEKHEIRQISATLDAVAGTLHTSIEQKLNTDPGLAIVLDEKKIPDFLDHPQDLTDSGWSKDKSRVLEPLVDGLSNQDIWLLVRRFNKRIFHLKEAPDHPPEYLDFHVAEEEEFSPNKLRAQLERLYMGMVYFTAWIADFLMPTLWITFMALLVSPRIRHILFPPAPLALVDYHTGGVSKPRAGLLASTDSATGAPENAKGEAMENEASNFVTGIAAIAMNVLTDEDPQHSNEQNGGGIADLLPPPNSLATKVATAKDKAIGVDRPSQDKTKAPMEKFMWSKMRPLMHQMCVVSDIWERCANLLSPTIPFSQDRDRYRVASLILPILILSIFTTCYTFCKVATFAVGLGFFGSPVLTQSYSWFRLPNCIAIDTSLEGFHTDAQLTITLLRLGEAHNLPLPPPPGLQKPPSHETRELTDDVLGASGGDRPLGATEEEIHEAVEKDQEMLNQAGGDDHEATISGSHGKRRSKVLGVFKIGARAAAKTLIGIDKLRAKAGAESAKTRLGAASSLEEPPIAGPVEFKGRYQGEQGFLYITTDAACPSLCFSTESSQDNSHGRILDELQPAWVIPIANITELNKYSGYGANAKLLAGWALDGKIMDGFEIVDRKGYSTLITSIPHRDELFNRLCAIGSQKWEVW
ncbi:hypothetical protein AK830_g10778 [Neonectria ditissima]|uniref:Uncharacterized protein n=1 Tax=Neonectria ditissima TaxID=78410 RepID=A0A0P7B5K1_9HYPO|nr:hypothetical protein AK830_g10778 [Neonectria ditissima]